MKAKVVPPWWFFPSVNALLTSAGVWFFTADAALTVLATALFLAWDLRRAVRPERR